MSSPRPGAEARPRPCRGLTEALWGRTLVWLHRVAGFTAISQLRAVYSIHTGTRGTRTTRARIMSTKYGIQYIQYIACTRTRTVILWYNNLETVFSISIIPERVQYPAPPWPARAKPARGWLSTSTRSNP